MCLGSTHQSSQNKTGAFPSKLYCGHRASAQHYIKRVTATEYIYIEHFLGSVGLTLKIQSQKN